MNAGADRRVENLRYVNDGSVRIIRDEDNLDRIILRTARRNGGIVTPAEVVIGGNVPLDKARKRLEQMTAYGHAEMRIRKSGVIVFAFPEFMNGNSDFETL
jgi:hypothetical protein